MQLFIDDNRLQQEALNMGFSSDEMNSFDQTAPIVKSVPGVKKAYCKAEQYPLGEI